MFRNCDVSEHCKTVTCLDSKEMMSKALFANHHVDVIDKEKPSYMF